MSIAPQQLRPDVVTPRGQHLTWSDDDRLWLLRAIEAEGEPRALVAQVLVNRWAWLHDENAGKYPRLADLVRAYAQPVNPRWYPDGSLFLDSIAKMPESQRPSAMKRAAIRRDVHSERTTFSQATIDAVRAALFGPVSIPLGALHFAAPSVLRSDLPVLVPSADIRQNTIYGERDPRAARARYALALNGQTHANPATRNALSIVAVFSFGIGRCPMVGVR